MPWRNSGDFYSFKPDSIDQHAPTLSGVYGLFNLRHHIVIASAANLHDSLLHQRVHGKFRFRRLQPTGFTFEVCPPERREQRAQELIAEFAPIAPSQGSLGITALLRSWRAPKVRAFKPAAVEQKPPEPKAPATEPARQETDAPGYFKPERFGLAGAVCGVIFLLIGMIGLVPHLKRMFDSVVRNPTANAESKQRLAGPAAPQPPSATAPASSTSQASIAPSAETSESAQPPAGLSAASVDTAPATAQATPAVPTAMAPGKPDSWSVQALATADLKLANNQLDKLKAKGFPAFIVTAEIKGQTWHRLRVGSFASRKEAEALRATLQDQEGLRDAYIAGNEKSPTTLALNRR